MRVLTSKYWNNFKKTKVDKSGKKKRVRDGKKFEELVQRILDLEYGPNRWKPTGESWDGSRDFEWRTSHSYKWAECKNYENRISLNVLSNTLIMAMIDFADEILIFSYSKIKQPVLKKILQFADVSEKKIKIYADESLEEIILHYFSDLQSDFFPSACSMGFNLEHLQPYISCQIIPDPIVAYTMNSDLGIMEKSPSIINFDTTLCLSIFICNRTYQKTAIDIRIEWEKKDFYILNSRMKDYTKFYLEANATTVKKIYFKVQKFNPNLHFPTVHIFCDSKEKIFSFGRVKCSWIGDCTLQGSSYRKIVDNFKTRVLNPPFFYALNIYGTSGVGKTRLLSECENIALGYGFRVIRFNTNFQNKKDYNVNNIIMEFICGLYDIPNIEDFFSDASEKKLTGIYEILSFIKKENISQKYINNTVLPVVIQKLRETHCYISIDNIQYYPAIFISFLHLIVEELLITNKHCKSRIGISFNTDYIYQQEKCVSLWNLLRSNKDRIINEKVSGFATKGETKLFLNQLLRNSDIDPEQAQAIISASNKNPFYVKTYLKWLETECIITPQKDEYVIPPSNSEIFNEKMHRIPDGIYSILEERWNYFLESHDETKNLEILGIIHIFQFLNNELIQSFSLSKKDINELCKFHFLITQRDTEIIYTFEHDLTEKFLVEKYTILCKYAFCKKEILQDINNIWYKVLYAIINNTKEKNSYNSLILEEELPHKIGYEIYMLWTSQTVKKMNSIPDLESNLEYITKICSLTREIYGTDAAINLYKYVVEKVHSEFSDYQANSNWAWGMVAYCNLLYERNFYKEAISVMKNLLKYWPDKKITPQNVLVYAYIYNRLHVYTRALNAQITRETLIWLEKAESTQELKETIEETLDEIKFLNLIDRGYCNYDCISSKENIVTAWTEACNIYEKGKIPTKKMNYLFAKMQIQLFQFDLSGAQLTIKKGLDVIELKEQGAYYFLYFKQRFLLCQIVQLLLSEQFRQNEIDDLFNQIEDYNYILKSRISYSVQWLKSIYYSLKRQFMDAFLCIQSAQEHLYANKKKTFQKYYLNQLHDNACYFLAKGIFDSNVLIDINQLSSRSLVSALKEIRQMSHAELKLYLKNHYANSILQDKEHKINFPPF